MRFGKITYMDLIERYGERIGIQRIRYNARLNWQLTGLAGRPTFDTLIDVETFLEKYETKV